jgi:hypothetical protein
VLSQANDPGKPAVDVFPVDGPLLVLTKVQFGAGWRISGTRDDGSAVTLSAEDLLAVRFSAKPAPAQPRGMQILLPGGPRLAGRSITSDDDRLRLQTSIFGDVAVPMTAVAALMLDPDAAATQVDRVALTASTLARTADHVLLKNGDAVVGSFIGIDKDALKLQRDGKSVSLAVADVFAVLFDPALVERRRDREFYGLLQCADGSSLPITGLESVGKKLKVSTTFAASFVADPSDLVDVSFRNGRVIYVSDLEPTEVVLEPYLANRGAFHVDRNVLGGRLQLDGRVYAKGLGVRSFSRLTYDVSECEQFEATVGLDDSAGPAASVRFRVELDRKPVFDSGELLVESEPKRVQVSLRGGKRMSLVVEYARRGDVQDYANWCDARLIRARRQRSKAED